MRTLVFLLLLIAIAWGAYKLASPYFFSDQANQKLNEFKSGGR